MSALRSAKKAAMAAMTAGLLLCGLRTPAQSLLTPEQTAGIAAYEAAISSGDPVAAVNFLNNNDLISALAAANPQKEASLKARAEALKDLKALMAMPWDAEKMNSLNQALTIRIDTDKPLCRVGVGPEPEKLLTWLEKFMPGYPEGKTKVVKKAIREWVAVFGPATEARSIKWGQARWPNNVVAAKADWATWTLSQRNSVMAQIIKENPTFLEYDDAALASMKNEMSLAQAVDKTIKSGALTQSQIAQLAGKELPDQVYLLGSFFDGSKVSVNPDLKAQINAARDSLPKEVLPAQQRAVLGTMLNTAVAKELAGTQAGAKVLAFYSGETKLNIAVKPCDGAYSRFDAASGTVLLDSENIQQYMRMKGYTADSLMKNKEQLQEVAKYVSPLVVYEAGHQMRASWAAKSGVYSPRVQEDEIEAMSLEGLYTTEKMRKDPEFNRIFTSSRKFSSYASKKLDVGTEYELSGSKKFATTVRQRYFSGLPSIDAAASQILEAVTAELGRRAAMTPAARAQLDSVGLSLAEAMEMTPAELSGSAGELGTPALEKLRKDLSDLSPYKASYQASDSDTRKALKNIRTGSSAQKGAPPVL